MTGHLDKAGHSWNMSRIRGKDTKPEIAVQENVRKSSPIGLPISIGNSSFYPLCFPFS